MILEIIPDRYNIDKSFDLAEKYGVSFEYNDFMTPDVLDNQGEIDERINMYLSHKLPENSTIHGAFLDITVFSSDRRIYEASDYRVRQSIEIGKKLGASGIVFHTNYIANFILESYRRDWVKKNTEYWKEKISQYPGINIYIENMFDTDPVLLYELGECMKDEKNFGVCLDYAHASCMSEVPTEKWAEALSPYVRHMHINDNDFVHDLHLPLGEGDIDWRKFSELYRKYFSGSSILIEHTDVKKQEKSIKFFNRLMSK